MHGVGIKIGEFCILHSLVKVSDAYAFKKNKLTILKLLLYINVQKDFWSAFGRVHKLDTYF